MFAIRPDPVASARRPAALALSLLVHGMLAAAWLLAPALRPEAAGQGPMQVELLVEAPPPPEPPEPEPANPEPPPPEPPKSVAPPDTPKPPPRAMPAARPRPAPTAADANASPPAAQPVMTDSPVAPAENTAPAAASAVPVAAPTARGVERDDYLRLVWARILRFRPERVPFAGTTRLRFTLGEDGSLAMAEVAESSGSGLLDRAALEAVRRAAPFPPPPAGIAPSFEIPFQFTVRR